MRKSMRLGPLVLVICVTACGGGKREANDSKPVGLTAGEGCIREANYDRYPPEDAPERIDIAHIVVKHDGVKGAIKKNITRSREDACRRATDARSIVLSGGDWEAAHKEFSDEQGPTRGAIHDLEQGDIDRAFSNAAFSLNVNEVSYVVESKQGFHVILRTR
jgi:peptidyl-prolyl cis-trans isomerase NIMA-interacting 1